MAEPDPLRELERQVERGNVFAHAVLGQHANRAGENEAIIRGLVELLDRARGRRAPTSWSRAVNAVRAETKFDVDVAIRIDDPSDAGRPARRLRGPPARSARPSAAGCASR